MWANYALRHKQNWAHYAIAAAYNPPTFQACHRKSYENREYVENTWTAPLRQMHV